MWGRKKESPEPVTVVYDVNMVEVDQAIAKMDAARKQLAIQEASLRNTIREAKQAKSELEVTIARSIKKARGGW